MLEFIAIMTIIYLIAIGLARLFGSKQPKREVYIIREYEVNDDMEAQQQPEQLPEEQGSQVRQEALPDNVVAIDLKKQ